MLYYECQYLISPSSDGLIPSDSYHIPYNHIYKVTVENIDTFTHTLETLDRRAGLWSCGGHA